MLKAGNLLLRRAGDGDLEAVIVLQRAAYARNREMLGAEPLPLMTDYAEIFRTYEVWITAEGPLDGVLILEPRPGDLLIWSIATDPRRQQGGLGRAMLAAAESRAHALGHNTMRLYTGTVLHHLVGWYARHGFTVERIEALSDRSLTHMVKHLGAPSSTVD